MTERTMFDAGNAKTIRDRAPQWQPGDRVLYTARILVDGHWDYDTWSGEVQSDVDDSRELGARVWVLFENGRKMFLPVALVRADPEHAVKQ